MQQSFGILFNGNENQLNTFINATKFFCNCVEVNFSRNEKHYITITATAEQALYLGMILSACYAKFEKEKNPII